MIYNMSSAAEIYARYCERFGTTFEYAVEPMMIPLYLAVPSMVAALAGGPALTTEMLEEIAKAEQPGKQKIE